MTDDFRELPPLALSHFAEFVGDMEQRLADSLRDGRLTEPDGGYLEALAKEHDAESTAPRPPDSQTRHDISFDGNTVVVRASGPRRHR